MRRGDTTRSLKRISNPMASQKESSRHGHESNREGGRPVVGKFLQRALPQLTAVRILEVHERAVDMLRREALTDQVLVLRFGSEPSEFGP